MRSPLEHEPGLVSGIGLITVRWALLEASLGRLLGRLLRSPGSGLAVYYATANFAQRIDLLEAALRGALEVEAHSRIAMALLAKVRRLWKTRNYLIHSHYVYHYKYEGGWEVVLTAEENELSSHPASPAEDDEDVPPLLSESLGFSYEKRKPDGSTEYIPVNAGTFANHARQLSKRVRQIETLTAYIAMGILPLKGEQPSTYYDRPSPRVRRNLTESPEPTAG